MSAVGDLKKKLSELLTREQKAKRDGNRDRIAKIRDTIKKTQREIRTIVATRNRELDREAAQLNSNQRLFSKELTRLDRSKADLKASISALKAKLTLLRDRQGRENQRADQLRKNLNKISKQLLIVKKSRSAE